MKNFVIVHSPTADIYLSPAAEKQNNKIQLSNCTDEALYGETGRILKKEGSWFYILMEYGYAGYMQKKDVTIFDQRAIDQWLFGPLIVTKRTIDILTIPSVHGFRLITVPGGAVLKITGNHVDGWTEVRLVNNSCGFIPDDSYEIRRYDSGLLKADSHTLIDAQNMSPDSRFKQQGGSSDFFLMPLLNKWYEGSEDAFRLSLVDTAKSYLGTQYRWGGRSSFGIDCSGLIECVYLRCGIAVFRDAVITDGYPLKKLDIDLEDLSVLKHADEAGILPGDTLYSPGHVMMYIGNNQYIHSTGKAGVCQVVINSLDYSSALYREDIAESIYAVAGLRF